MGDEEYNARAERGRVSLKNYLRSDEFYREAYTAVYKEG